MNDTPIPWESVSPELEPGLEDRIRRQLEAERPSAKPAAADSNRRSRPVVVDETGTPSPKTYSRRFKYEVTLEAIRGVLTQREISTRYQVPQPLVSRWKNLGLEAIEELIASPHRRKFPMIKPVNTLDVSIAAGDQISLMALYDSMRKATVQLEELIRRSGVRFQSGAEEE